MTRILKKKNDVKIPYLSANWKPAANLILLSVQHKNKTGPKRSPNEQRLRKIETAVYTHGYSVVYTRQRACMVKQVIATRCENQFF